MSVRSILRFSETHAQCVVCRSFYNLRRQGKTPCKFSRYHRVAEWSRLTDCKAEYISSRRFESGSHLVLFFHFFINQHIQHGPPLGARPPCGAVLMGAALAAPISGPGLGPAVQPGAVGPQASPPYLFSMNLQIVHGLLGLLLHQC